VSIIAAQGLTRRYGRFVAVDSLDLSVPAGTIFGFLGPNGAGKTTTIRMLLGLLRPSAGRVSIGGRDCWRDSPRIKHDIGYLPGDLRLYPSWSTATALRVVGRIRGRDMTTPGRALAERFSLDSNVPVRAMSRGMRQKLGLILALAHRPKLLILDEPTASLDPIMQQALAEHLRQAAAEGGTVFFSSHTLSEVENLCDRVAIVREGRIVANDTIEALRERARREVRIVFADAEAAARIDPPAALALRARHGPVWHGELLSDAMTLVRWAAAQPIRDIAIHPPNLERLFQSFYQASGAATAGLAPPPEAST
jgi:ABC-2 type transport system ATP-binding protein